MIISLDYDNTYTLDPLLWDMIIDKFHKRGHEVICVTMRYPHEGQEVAESIGLRCKIIYTERVAKMIHLNELGIHIDVWIDDTPAWIFNNG